MVYLGHKFTWLIKLYTKMNFILGHCGRAEIQAWLLCGWHLGNTDWTDYKVTSVLPVKTL